MNVHATSSTIDTLLKLSSTVSKLERWRDNIERSLAYTEGTHTFDDLVRLTITDHLLFFATDEAFAFMQKVTFPQYSNLNCFLAGGDLVALEARTEDMRAIAAALGCRYLTVTGRHGFQRFLRSKGWQHDCTTMSTPVGEG
jgi:hypothetical protein